MTCTIKYIELRFKKGTEYTCISSVPMLIHFPVDQPVIQLINWSFCLLTRYPVDISLYDFTNTCLVLFVNRSKDIFLKASFPTRVEAF